MNQQSLAIEIEALSFEYGHNRVLDSVSFTIVSGQKIGLIGLNGSGKSTLLRHIVGLLTPLSGMCKIMGVAVTKKNLKEIRKDVGLIFQNSEDQLFMPTVFEDVAFGPRHMNVENDVTAYTLINLKEMGIEHLKDRSPSDLSGGEKRMVSIATVTAMKPKIILMDEPTEGLDARAKRKVVEFVNHANQTMLISSHDMTVIEKTCDHVIVLEKGKVIRLGIAKEILSDVEFLKKHELI